MEEKWLGLYGDEGRGGGAKKYANSRLFVEGLCDRGGRESRPESFKYNGIRHANMSVITCDTTDCSQ